MNWDKEIAKAERAMARNKANILNAPTSRGTAASWSAPKYDLARPVQDVDKMHEKDRKKRRKARIRHKIDSNRRDNLHKMKASEKYIERYSKDPHQKPFLDELLKLDLIEVKKNDRPKKRGRKRGQSKYKGRKPKGPFYTDPRTKEL